MSLMPSSDYWRIFQHLSSSIKAPLFLYHSKPNSRFLLKSMKQHRSLFLYPAFPCRTVNTGFILANQSESKPKSILNCVKQTESPSVRPVVYQRKVHAVPLPVLGIAATLQAKRENELQELLISLREKLYEAGIRLDLDKPGQYGHFECPQCPKGGSKVKSLYLRIHSQGHSAVWKCFNTECGWTGFVQACSSKVSTETQASKVNAEAEKQKQPRKITEKELKLEPLCNELLAYFKSRGIHSKTLRRNRVMQRPTKAGPAIAFIYRRDGALVNCKYRRMPKIFWQEAGTEKILYGLDDIKDENDIIIVEGEIDKLSMEEAGFRNCVSVPNGAPPHISNKEIPAQEEDTKYQYLWACKEYLKAASRIILATDADGPGQALAEELARRLGKERCWIVKWPMRNDDKFCKDANEVLCYKGKKTLRKVIENAEMYPI